MITATSNESKTISPISGEAIASYPFDSKEQVERVVQQSFEASQQWKNTSVADRVDALVAIGQALRENSEELAQMMTLEMGKPIGQARGEVTKSANLCDWYATHGPDMLATRPTLVENQQAVQEFRPLGVLLGIMPWNFPLWQVMRGAVPMMLSGNTYILKHAPNIMGCAYMIERILNSTGLPQGVFSLIHATNDRVSDVIADDRVAGVAFTGSVGAGKTIGSQAGAALKKSILELGGSDPFIVLADANMDEAVKAAVAGRYQNNGQVCAAAKRFIVEASVAEEFTQKFVAAVKALTIGDPRKDENYIGPMARFDLRDELHEQVQRTIQQGASLLLGGDKMDGSGNYYQPTVLADVTPEMTAFREEMFGPVAAISVVNDAEHACRLANDSDFGLCATIYSGDEHRAQHMAAQLECGGVFINGYCGSDPRVTFGGVKKSGYGRELSDFGLYEFCNVQTVWKNRQS